MPKDMLDVIDTAVKIGLGATISGVTAFFVGRSSHKSEKNKFLLEHKLQTIEKATEGFEQYFNSLNRFIGQAAGIERWRQENEKGGEPYLASQKKAINDADKDLVESWPARDHAISKLRLLTAEKTLNFLMIVSNKEKDFRDSIVFGNGEFPDYESITETRVQVRNEIKKFHKELAIFYTKLGA